MRRKFFTFVSVLSLLLGAATVVMWVISYFLQTALLKTVLITDGSGRLYDRRYRTTAVRNGVLYYREDGYGSNLSSPRPPITITKTARSFTHLPAGFFDRTALGFSWTYELRSHAGYSMSSQKSMPLWFVLLCLLAAWMYARRRNQPEHPACHTCGYSLTGNTSGTCPECGSPVSQASPPA